MAGGEQVSQKHPVPRMVLCACPSLLGLSFPLPREVVSLLTYALADPSMGTGKVTGWGEQRGHFLAFPFYPTPLVSHK